MKKVTIALFMVLCVVFAGRCYYESQKPPVRNDGGALIITTPQTTNKQLSNYEGRKKRGSDVKALISLVDTLNVREVFPISIRYGDVLPDSYDWVVSTTRNLNSGDTIRDSGWFEVVMQDQLPENNVDGYLDTITIRPYSLNMVTNNSPSLSGE